MSKKKPGSKKKAFEKEPVTEQEITAKTDEFVIKKDDFALLELTGRIKNSGKLMDVTDEEIARKEGVYDEKDIYQPRLVIVGRGWVIKGVDKLLEELVVGVSKTVEIPPEDAFGIKDAKNIKTYSIREIQKHVKKPQPGASVVLEGRRGFIRVIAQGRVRVDFNHPLAGETIIYEVKVKKKVTDENEKIFELIKRRIPKIEPSKINIAKEDGYIAIYLPKEVYFDQNLPIAKIGIASEVQEYIIGVEGVKFVEIYGKELFKPALNASMPDDHSHKDHSHEE